jgi:hypothetical protein
MGFTARPPSQESTIFNPNYYALATDVLSLEMADTLYLSKSDYRMSYLSSITMGEAAPMSALVVDANRSITGLNAISCSALTVGGVAVGTLPSFLDGITPGMAANNKALVLDGSGAIATIASLTATNIYGSIKTADQPCITSFGTLSSLAISNQPTTTNGSLMSEYALSLTHPISNNGNRVGMVFGVAANQLNLYTGGASIVHTRSAPNSVGSLAFNIRTTQGPLDSLVEAYRVNADASTTFNYPMTIDSNLVFSDYFRTFITDGNDASWYPIYSCSNEHHRSRYSNQFNAQYWFYWLIHT